MNEPEEELSYSTSWVRTRIDENGQQLWRVATDVEKALAKAVGIPVHKLYTNGESN